MAKSPFEIELSEEEARGLRSRAGRYTAPHGEVLRAKIVLLAAEGRTNAEIARRLDCALRTVSLWRKRFSEERREGLADRPPPGRPRRFPPGRGRAGEGDRLRAAANGGVPLSRFSRAELHRLVVERGVCEASASTIARWLREDALKPWQHRSWIFPTDPAFLEKAGPVLDLYQGRWQGRLLHPGEFVICADEKPSIQARGRIHETLPPAPRSRGQRVEHTYQRRGALTYLAALDIGRRGGRRPRVFGRSEASGGIVSFDRLVWRVMTKEPYASARRVFWIVDNGSSHRGRKSVERLERRWPNLVLVHLPVHASWLNQIEIYFSIVQRKLLEPNDFQDASEVARTLNAFEQHWNTIAEPFDWNFTRDDLAALIERLAAHKPQLQLAA